MLEIRNLTKRFGGLTAVDDISFRVAKGHIHAVIGPNGAGKTTLINTISGVYRSDGGSVWLDGADITDTPTDQLVYRGICRTFQNLEICGGMTVLENVMLGFDRYLSKGLWPTLLRSRKLLEEERRYTERAMHLLELIDIRDYAHQKAHNLSYGILKKLEIVRALATGPELLLLDEPVAGLNPKETAEVAELIRTIVTDEVTVILIEHDMRMVMELSDRITVMHFGKKLAEGPPEEIRNDPEVIEAYLGGNR
ncbi:ABC transporter ATP-binding protein [Nitratifractor sp.]|uniref:ABC transporter ATP-binding protein n=1 Tax=Nitratifractor sp. TaxID=2268144 RepID=UPI0025E1E4A1|nr:ABC transporter ATP-binding protein [Nitratifractor sp.]